MISSDCYGSMAISQRHKCSIYDHYTCTTQLATQRTSEVRRMRQLLLLLRYSNCRLHTHTETESPYQHAEYRFMAFIFHFFYPIVARSQSRVPAYVDAHTESGQSLMRCYRPGAAFPATTSHAGGQSVTAATELI